MQPDPTIFIPAIRRELIRPQFFGAEELAQGWSRAIAARSTEVLAHLAVGTTALPSIMESVLPQLRQLADQASTACLRAGVAPPFANDGLGEYDTCYTLVSIAIGKLTEIQARVPEARAALQTLVPAAIEVEQHFLSRYGKAMQRIKDDDEAFLQNGSPTPTLPSDADVATLIRVEHPTWPKIEVRNVARKFTETANEIFFFDLGGTPDFAGPMVLRRGGGFDVTNGSVTEEHALLGALHRLGLPVARTLAAGVDPASGAPYLIMARSPGRTMVRDELRGDIAAIEHVASTLAAVHRADTRVLPPPYRADPAARSAPYFLAALDKARNRWQQRKADDSLLLETAYAWLTGHAQRLREPVALVHGDFNLRNILFHDTGVVALDWELSHLGHPGEDLAFLKTDIEALMPWDDFLDLYERHGGIRLDHETMHYFDVWTCFWRACLSACVYPGYWRGEHKNFFFASICCNEYFHETRKLAELLSGKAS